MKRKIQERNTYVTLEQSFNEFIQQKEANGLSPATLRNYKLSYHIFFDYNEFDSETPITEINQNLINKWINHMRKEEISPSSINHYLRDFRTFVNFCIKREYIDVPIEIKEVKQQEELPKFYSDEDIEKLLRKPENNDTFAKWRMWGIVNFVLATGARAATIRNIKLDDIDFNNGVVNLSNHTKNREALNIPLSSTLENALREYTRKWHISDYLFPNIGDEQLTDGALRSAYVRYCQDRDVEQTNIHGLRHSFARAWIINGGNQFKLQRIMGHKNLSMTNRYVKLFAQDLKTDYESYSALDVIKKKSKRTSQFKKGR